jgi:NDP-sugar pyrophosphorylase family protein
MIARVLAAGRGERMLPLTRLLPKPAIPVLGRPLIEQVLRGLGRQGIERVVMNLHHLPDLVENLIGDGRSLGLERVEYSREETILGTAGGIRNAAHSLLGEGPILVRNSDFLCDVDLARLESAHLASGALATLVLAPSRPGYSVVEVDRDGGVLSLAGLPSPADPKRVAGRYLFTGLHMIEEDVVDRIPRRGASDIVRDVYVRLVEEQRLASVIHDGFWWEFGAPLDFLEGCLRLFDLPLEERAKVADTDSIRTIGRAMVALGCGVELDPASVELVGRVALGFAALVGEGTSLQDTIVMNEAWVGPGCRLERAIVAPGTEVPAGLRVENALICADSDSTESLPTHIVREGGLLLTPITLARA